MHAHLRKQILVNSDHKVPLSQKSTLGFCLRQLSAKGLESTFSTLLTYSHLIYNVQQRLFSGSMESR
jgi:hypothetical protein